ncbi:Hsp70 family protein [Pseudomonadota bacterium]
MANIIGIDLGTTYSVVASLTSDGRADVLRDSDNNNLTPSVVFFEGDNQMLVGWDAKRASSIQPDMVAEYFKRQMGENKSLDIGDHKLTPAELSTLVIKKLRQIAEDQLGSVDEAVITVPANFTNQARQDTINAGKAAGLDVKHIINEPTAAAIYYAQQQHVQGKAAVYDLGGGTFDCSIVEIRGQDVEILSSQGNQRLGGHDFDRKLLELIQNKFEAETGSKYKLQPGDVGGGIEELKKSLSKRSKVKATLSPVEGGRVNISVTQEEFADTISTLITKAEMLVEEALDEVSLSPNQIDHVVLVGGSTRVPAVQASIRKLFGQEPKAIANVDEAIALGATIYAAIKSDTSVLNVAQKAAVANVGIDEVCNHFFGTIALSFDEERNEAERRVSILIPKNSPLPCEVSEPFYTVHDDQTSVRCSVTQSPAEETDPRWVTTVWEGNIGPLPDGRAAGQEIRVTFAYDSNATLHCSFVDIDSGQKTEVSLDQRSADGAAAINIEEFVVD